MINILYTIMIFFTVSFCCILLSNVRNGLMFVVAFAD